MPKINEQKIIEAIQKAEKSTSAEIVPLIVKRSSTTGHVPVILFFIFIVLFLELGFKSFYGEILEFFISGLLALFLSRFPFIQRLLTSKKDMQIQAMRRAQFEFYDIGLQKTKKSTGVLLFVSLMEHKAVVLADKTISEKLPEDTWKEVLSVLITGIKKQDLTSGIVQAIEHCSQILSFHFPPEQENINEIPDRILIKE